MGMLINIFNAMEQVPVLIADIFSRYMIPAILCCIVYVLVLFFSNKVFDAVRKLVVLALIGWICVGLYRYRGAKGTLAPVALACTLLLFLAVVRMIRQIIVSTKETITNRRIEKQALAKAAKRRGSWKMRQGRSGPAPEETAAPSEEGTDEEGEDPEEEVEPFVPEAANAEVAPVKETVAFDDFTKLDIRVATVLECERVPKMKKLLKFKLDDGTPKGRTIVSGIAQWYEPEQLVGKQVLFIANLAPREFKNGLVSEGMILSAENYDGSISVTTVEKPVKGGSQVC